MVKTRVVELIKNKYKRRKKNNPKITFLKSKNMLVGIVVGTILGGLVFGGIGVVAITLSAEQVTYTPQDAEFKADNTKDAIDELYEMAKNASNDSIFSIPITLYANGYGYINHSGSRSRSWEQSCSNELVIPLEDAEHIISATVISGKVMYNGTTYYSGETIEISKTEDSVFSISVFESGNSTASSHSVSTSASFTLNFE